MPYNPRHHSTREGTWILMPRALYPKSSVSANSTLIMYCSSTAVKWNILLIDYIIYSYSLILYICFIFLSFFFLFILDFLFHNYLLLCSFSYSFNLTNSRTFTISSRFIFSSLVIIYFLLLKSSLLNLICFILSFKSVTLPSLL